MALTIRTNTDEDNMISKLCDHLNIKTASKLVLFLIGNYFPAQEKNDKLKKEIKKLKCELETANKLISDFQGSLSGIINYKN